MAHDTKIILSKPLLTPEQLESYLILRGCLQERPETVSDEDKKAFCLLILSSCPAVMDTADLVLVQKLCPEEWRHYLQGEWGTPEELRELKEEALLAQGWVRLPDGEMYFPFP